MLLETIILKAGGGMTLYFENSKKQERGIASSLPESEKLKGIYDELFTVQR